MEIFLRYDRGSRMFHFKNGEAEPVTHISDSAMPEVIRKLGDKPGGDKMADVWRALVDAARADKEGKWVSASSETPSEGQAAIGNGGG